MSDSFASFAQVGGLIGDLAAAGAVDLKAMARHMLEAGEPAEAGALGQKHSV